ncbi:MAG: serine/threonine protein phosphatase [Kordiimonadaceae bacterium]|jgi:hypothetical protein|nr:serine/threonine protein phosphatase [Kordiimonadaceae bacterium]MBT6033603.1 serine/threonine protein phosphatase [Kordiimonadaceae bacterium]
MINFHKGILLSVFILSSCAPAPEVDPQFTIAVISDTQNYVDFSRQKNQGFPIDAADLFIEQMEYLAANTQARGGKIAFATSVGDVWQNYKIGVDDEHFDRGLRMLPRTQAWPASVVNAGVSDFELPLTRRGYDLLAGTGVPFSVAPGNHDYEKWWTVNPEPADLAAKANLIAEKTRPNTHVGGYGTFNGVFGPDSTYFKDKNWYISSFNGGVNSAQIFDAGGYSFLHFGFEMQAGDDVLAWAQSVIDQHPGFPTIMSTHDYLNPRGERLAAASMDLAKYDPLGHNSAEDIWNDFIKKNDQIFMILSGHQIGQATRIDKNEAGNDVYQLLSDYQGRGKAANPTSTPARQYATGDGWLRLMEFYMGGEVPSIKVRTYSTYYKAYSNEHTDYGASYREMEQPDMTDAEFNEADDFIITLGDFKTRFGDPKQ